VDLTGCNVLNRNTVGENEDQRNDVHGGEEGDNNVLYIDIFLPPFSYSDQHPADAELDGDDGGTIADFEYKKELLSFGLVFLISGLRES
jgi:hypothetical protein